MQSASLRTRPVLQFQSTVREEGCDWASLVFWGEERQLTILLFPKVLSTEIIQNSYSFLELGIFYQ